MRQVLRSVKRQICMEGIAQPDAKNHKGFTERIKKRKSVG
jgi:hypothetical protein